MKPRSDFTADSHFSNSLRLAAMLAISSATIPLARAGDLYWRTDGTGATLTSANWSTTGSAPFTSAWANSSDIFFTSTSAITNVTNTPVGNITISGASTITLTAAGTYNPGGAIRTVDIGTGSSLIWNAQAVSTVAGNGFIKSGGGTWNIGAQANLFTGGFNLNAGTIITSGNNALGGSTLTLNGGTWQSTGTRAYAITSLAIGGNFSIEGTGNAILANTAATISLGSSTRTISNDTTSGSRQFLGLISGGTNAGLTIVGSGSAQIYFGNTGNTFTGPVAINGGEVVFNGNGAFGATTSITLDGGRLTTAAMDSGGNTSALTSATISSDKNLNVGSAAGTAISVQGATGVLSYNGVIADKAGSTGAWAKQGAGRLELGGVSTYTGNTSINNGVVRLTTGNDRLPTSTVVALGQASSSNVGTLDLNGNSQKITGLVSTAGTNASVSKNTVTSTTAATLTLDGSETYSYGAGTTANSGVITGAISLVKNGDGTQILGDSNTYSGTTTVNSGKLLINGNISTSITTVNDGGTLGGAGTVGALTVRSGGTLAPGNSPGILSAGNVILEAGSSLGIEISGINPGSQHDQLNVTGTVSLAGLLSVTTAGFTAAENTLFFIVLNDGADSITGTFSNAPDNGGVYNLGGQDFQISYFGNYTGPGIGTFTGGNDVVLMAVPEPAATLLGTLGTLGFLALLRRRR